MMTCPKCSREVDAQWKFCNYCGEGIAIACQSCGGVNPADALFCHDCGERLTSGSAPTSPWRALNVERQTPVGQPASLPSPTNPSPSVGPSPSLVCPRCHTVNEPGSAYCYSCGLPLNEESPDSQARPAAVPPLHAKQYKSIGARSNWTVALISASCIAAGLSLVVALDVLDMAWQSEAGQYVSLIDLEEALFNLQGLTAFIYVLWVPAAVAFLMWLYRASKNLEPLGASAQRFSPAWAVGWWFVPIWWFFRPYQVVAEIWRGSTADLPLDEEDGWKRRAVSPLIGFWWALWLIAQFAIGAIDFEPLPLQPSSDSLLLSLFAYAIWIAAGILVIMIVHRIRRGQEANYIRLTGG